MIQEIEDNWKICGKESTFASNYISSDNKVLYWLANIKDENNT